MKLKVFFLLLFTIFLFPMLAKQSNAQTCGDLYENKRTYCRLIEVINNGVAPYGGCGLGQQCFIGADVGQSECSWVMDTEGLKFCYGGFDSNEALRQSRVELRCVGNCGGAVTNVLDGDVVQSYDNRNTPDGNIGDDGSGGKYSCILAEGGLDQSVYNAVRYQIDATSAACGVLGVGEFLIPGAAAARAVAGASRIVRVVTMPVRVGVNAAAAGGAAITTNLCLQAANNYHPTFEARVMDNSGTNLCNRELSVSVQATGEITSEGGDDGGVPPGTVIQDDVGPVILCEGGRMGVDTAIGCIPYDFIGAFRFVMGWSIGVAGGVALVLIIYSGIMMMLSAGDPGRLEEAKSLFIAAVSGLLLIIFSAFLLRLIGINILDLF